MENIDDKIQEIFSNYSYNEYHMNIKDFRKLINDYNLFNKYQIESLYIKHCIFGKFNPNSLLYAFKDIARRKQIQCEDIITDIINKINQVEIEKINQKKEKIIERNIEKNLNAKEPKKSDEKVKELLEDMCFMGSAMKKEIIEEKKKNPEKFIPIDEAIKEDKGNTNFCLGILAQNLENMGITIAIEKDSSNDENSVKSSEMVIQFIMNGMIDKKKYDLHFDFGPKRNNELLTNIEEQEKFHNKIKKALNREFQINEENILITNPQKGSYNVQIILLNEDSDRDLDIARFQEKCKNSKEFEELCYLRDIKEILIMEGCKLSADMLDPAGNRSSGWGENEKRGGLDYIPPKGWIGFGLKVTGKFDNGNDDWLASNGNSNEWAIAYHAVGTRIVKKLEEAVGNIAKGGFKIGPRQKFKDSVNEKGQTIGRGVYCSPDPEVLEAYARGAKSETVVDGKKYMMGFMMRVKPDKINIPVEQPDYWVLNGTTDEMRPYRILIKENN